MSETLPTIDEVKHFFEKVETDIESKKGEDTLYFPRCQDGSMEPFAPLQVLDTAIAVCKNREKGIEYQHMGSNENYCWLELRYTDFEEYARFLECNNLAHFSKNYAQLAERAAGGWEEERCCYM
jgi:hypothetical protein